MKTQRKCYCGDPDICSMACSTRGGGAPTSWPPLDGLPAKPNDAAPPTRAEVKEIVLELLRLNRLIR